MKRQEALKRYQVLRGKTRDFDVIEICDIMIGLLTAAVAKEQRANFDRNKYQREYMRKWRAEKKGGAT